jgi:hypothetical protein
LVTVTTAPVELLDALAQIGLGDRDATPFKEGPHLTFLGQHRLGLHQGLRPMGAEDLVDDLVVLVRVPRPVHMHAIGRGPLLELLQVVREVRQRVLFDLRG